ncbi:P-loop containing nucleoside triphosphate hydrolase protein [Phyllosticta capitalensis]
MAGITDPDELSILSHQRSTGAPHGAFDASQFKTQVGQEVRPDVIEKLQKEFGKDMAGAIDKFLDVDQKMQDSAASGEDTKGEKSQDEGSGGDGTNQPDPLGRKAFVIRDRYWDRYKRQYVTQKPAKAKKESKKHRKCVIFVRRDYSEDMTSFTTVLIISGAVLRNALRQIFRGAEGFSLTESEKTELDPKFLFWARPELEILADHYRSVEDHTGIFEIDSSLKFIASHYEEMIPILPSLIPHSITFEYLWTLLPPDCLVVGKDALDSDSMWSVRSHNVEQTQEGVMLIMKAENIVWDGTKVGNVKQTLQIPLFTGLKLIRDLPYVPLKFHPQREAVMQRVRGRSAKALKFWKPQFQHREHDGAALAEVYDKVEHYPFSGRVMVDPKMMRKMQPANCIMPRSRQIKGLRKYSRVWLSDLTTNDERRGVLEALLQDASKSNDEAIKRPRSPSFPPIPPPCFPFDYDSDSSFSSPSASPEKSLATKEVELTEEQMLLVSGILFGYSLREGKWGAFSVDNVSDIEWNDAIFDSLVMEKSLKEVIYKLVVAHSKGASTFDDFVKGKGKGLIGLLFGPPGSGKTLTAEAIAETAKMPLYSVSSGALGHEATQIHERLSDILKLASHWKAVLLLDEADVFLAQRTITDIERNAIVSVFLRELEYYQGFLLLTTNQADVIDEAFQSRIHLSLQYPSLDAAARLKIWDTFLRSAQKSKGIEVDINEEGLKTLAEMPLNGRQIKNTVSIVTKIASSSESHIITAEYLKNTVDLLQSSPFHRKTLKPVD